MSYTAEPKQQDTNIKVPLISKIAYGIPYDKITDQNAAGRSGQGLCRFAVQISL